MARSRWPSSIFAWVILFGLPLALSAQTATAQFSSVELPAGNGPRSAVLIDLDRDGIRDLAVANLRGSNITLHFGNGSGSFALRDSLPTIHKAPHAIAFADFDEDGALDLVTANRDSHTVAVFTGDGTGGFRSPVFFATGQGPRWIAVADFDEDDHLDLAVTNRDDDNVTVLLGDGNGNFVPTGAFQTGDGPVPIAAADFDGDGLIDLAVGNDLADSLVVLGGDGSGGFARLSVFPVGEAPKHIAIGDLNLDGLSDLAVSCLLDGTVTILIADGQGGFATQSQAATGGSFAAVIEDFDGDGRRDLAVADGVNDQVAILLGDRVGGFASAQTFPTGLGPHAIVSGDFNGDGRPDLATPNTGDNTVTTLLNETPPQESVFQVAVIQKLYSDFFPDPIISSVDRPLRLLVTTDSREHLNRLQLLPFISQTDVVRVGEITTVEFSPRNTGSFQIRNLGHGFTGELSFVSDLAAVDAEVVARGRQSASLIHSNAQAQIIPSTLRLLKGIPATIYNISLDDQHWVSIEPWVIAPQSTETGNVQPRTVTLFEFTPSDTGSYAIQHTVHGFAGVLRVEDPLPTGAVDLTPSVSADFDNDGVVDFSDFFLFADRFGSTGEDEDWDPRYDLDSSGNVDFQDFFIFADNFGKVE